MKKKLYILHRNLVYLFVGRGIGFFTKLSLKFKKRYVSGAIRFFGKAFTYGDASSFVSTYEEIFIKDIYKFRASTDAPVILDCGANIGLSAIDFKRQYPKAKITAFEPDSSINAVLAANLKQQGYADVEVVQKAIWIHDGEILFHEQGGLSGAIVEECAHQADIVRIPCVRLKNLLSTKIDFLKIDIEGAELEVMQDCAESLGNVARMFIEYHSHLNKPQALDTLLSIIHKAGFRYQIQEAYTSPQPFMKVNDMLGMDLQLNIFCYRN